jgi:hypothetical protein
MARGIAARRFDFNDIGAVIGEHHGAIRSGKMAGQVEHQQMIECSGHSSPS